MNEKEETSFAQCEASLPWRYQPRAGLSDRSLTLPVAPRGEPGVNAERPRGARAASLALASTRASFPAQSAFHRQVLLISLSRAKNPPPFSRFSHRRAGFRRSFAILELSLGKARPPYVIHRFFTCGRGDHASLDDFCNQSRSASTTARPTKPCSHPRGRPRRTLLLQAFALLSELEKPRGHGPGTGMARPRPAPPTAIARGGSFTPTRSARTPLVAYPFEFGEETPPLQTLFRGNAELAWRNRFRGSRRKGPPLTSLREEGRNPLHPRCLPSTSLPLKGWRSYPHFFHRALSACGVGQD
jgi:hypothetical protein